MRIAFYGSSLLSAYWNGAATYYRGVLSHLAPLGHDITFYEPDAFERQQHRDIDPPDYARVVVYPATVAGLRSVLAEASAADVVVKASGVGVFDDELLAGVIAHAKPSALRLFWDVDAAATLDAMRADADHPLRAALPQLDLVLTYGGGPPVVDAYASFGARRCVPIYNALDPATHHPVAPAPRFAADLAFLANRLPDREARVEAFFLDAAARAPGRAFLLGGNGWHDKAMPPNVRAIGHVGTADHNAFNCSSAAVLNVAATAWPRSASRRRPACSRPPAPAPASSPMPGRGSSCFSSRSARCWSRATEATSPSTCFGSRRRGRRRSARPPAGASCRATPTPSAPSSSTRC